jgi:hypothetical protein
MFGDLMGMMGKLKETQQKIEETVSINRNKKYEENSQHYQKKLERKQTS